MIEDDLRKKLSAAWNGWIDWLEPRGGAGIGRPDCDLFVGGKIVPVELKIGEFVENGTGDGFWFHVPKMRPDQVSWHHRFKRAGGDSYWLFMNSEGNKFWLCKDIISARSGKQYEFMRKARIDSNGQIDDITIRMILQAWSWL